MGQEVLWRRSGEVMKGHGRFPVFSGEVDNADKLIRKCLLDTFRQTDEDFLKKASSQ